MVVSIQTNHTCHVTSTQLRDYFFLIKVFSSLSPCWFFICGGKCCRPIILCTVQGYFLRARQRSDAISVTRPDRWVRSEVVSLTPHWDMRWQVHHIITTSSLHSYVGASFGKTEHIRIHVHLFDGPGKIHMHSSLIRISSKSHKIHFGATTQPLFSSLDSHSSQVRISTLLFLFLLCCISRGTTAALSISAILYQK